jgi:hypothetical protein
MEQGDEFERRISKLFYRTSAQTVGARAEEAKVPEHGRTGAFSTHLAKAGLYKNHSLSTAVDREPYVDGSKDWMDKIY